VIPPRRGFVKSDRVVRRLARSIGHARFSDMTRALRVVATDLDTLERVVFSTGEVAESVAASIAIPGICVPVTIDGETLIDGGIADPLPVDVLQEMGVERIIAVNTIPTPERMRMWLDAEREIKSQHPPKRGIGDFLNTHLNYFARGNVLDIMLRSIHGVQTRVAERASRDADVVLRPWACDARWHDFAHPGKYIALGRKTAEEKIEELKSLVKLKVSNVPHLGKRRVAVAA
jgi:NTE family protein